jgi:hypothetical protein
MLKGIDVTGRSRSMDYMAKILCLSWLEMRKSISSLLKHLVYVSFFDISHKEKLLLFEKLS